MYVPLGSDHARVRPVRFPLRRHPREPGPRSAPPNPNSEAARQRKTQLRQRLIDDLAARHRQFTAKPADRQSTKVPNDDPGWNGHAQAFPAWAPPDETRSRSRPAPVILPLSHSDISR
jgi:hypothetical protein